MSRSFWIRVVLGIAAVSALGGAAMASGKVSSFIGDLTGIGRPSAPETTGKPGRLSPTALPSIPADGTGSVAAASEGTAPASFATSETSGENPPVVEPVVEGMLGSNGWYTSDVALSWKIEGGTAAEGSCAPETISTDGTTEHSCTATAEDGSSRTTKATIARDATPPTAAATADRAPNGAGWYNSAFTVTWAGEDATSGIDSCTAPATYSGPDTTTGSLDGSCSDKAGNVTAASYAFKYDATAPEVTGTPDRDPDHNGWYNKTVTITWSSESGATCDEPTVYNGPDGEVKLSGKCTDEAGNTGTWSVMIKFDTTAPAIVINAPDDGGIYILRQPVPAAYFCTDGTSGVASCNGTVADGANIDTSSVGAHSFAVAAQDQAGNKASESRTYRVRYSPAGVLCGGVRGHEVLEPVASDGSSVFNQGRTVPVKFRVCDFFGNPVTTASVVKSFRIESVDGEEADLAPKSTSSHEAFRAGESQWIFNLDTKPLKAGSRYGFRIALDDGTSIAFAFTLR